MIRCWQLLKSSEEKSIPVLMLGGHSATRDSEPGRRGSFGRTSSASSSIRRRSFSLSGVLPSQIDDNIESESVSEAGDIGDRALHSNRHSRSGSLRFSFDHVSENGVVIPIPEDTLSHSSGHFAHDPAATNPVSPILPLPEELLSPISTDAMVQAENKMQVSFPLLFFFNFFGILQHSPNFKLLIDGINESNLAFNAHIMREAYNTIFLCVFYCAFFLS